MISSCSLPHKAKGLTARTPKEQPSGSALTIQHHPLRHGDLSSDPWQKIRETATSTYELRFRMGVDGKRQGNRSP